MCDFSADLEQKVSHHKEATHAVVKTEAFQCDQGYKKIINH